MKCSLCGNRIIEDPEAPKNSYCESYDYYYDDSTKCTSLYPRTENSSYSISVYGNHNTVYVYKFNKKSVTHTTLLLNKNKMDWFNLSKERLVDKLNKLFILV